MAASPSHKLIGCRNYSGKIPLPTGTNLVKSGRIMERGADFGKAQYAYRHADTGTWYQVTALFDDRRPPPQAQRQYRVCEYVGADCPCAGGKL